MIKPTRSRYVISILVALALALCSFWLHMVLKSPDSRDKTLRTDPDYHMDNFRNFTVKFTGEPSSLISGKKLTHYPDNDSSIINFPIIESIDQQKRLQITYSDWAYLEDEKSKLHMHENVVVLRPGDQKIEPFHMTTDYLLILPDEDLMRTDQPVEAYQGQRYLNGVGMESNNATRELFVLDRVKMIYPPKMKK